MKQIFLLICICSQMALAQGVAGTETVNSPSTEEFTTALETPTPVPVEKVQAESEIPLNYNEQKKSASSDGIAGKVIYSLAILMMLAGGLFYFLKRYSIPKTSKSQTQIKILSQHYFGPKKSVALIRVAGESILIGVTDNQINLVKSMSLLDEDVPEEVPQNFSKTLKSKASDDELGATETGEEFAISGIRDIVQRKLQGMRNI